MYRKTISTVACILVWTSFSGTATAQDAKESPDETEIPQFNLLRTPDSPAFVILGVSPTEIQRPNSVKALSTSFGNSFTKDSTFIIPENIAVEIAPYWLFGHAELNYNDFIDAGFFCKLIQNLTFSVGTSNEVVKDESTNEEHTTSLIGFGVRSTVIESRNSSNFGADQKKALKRFNDIVNRITNEVTLKCVDEKCSDKELEKRLAEVGKTIEEKKSSDPTVQKQLDELKKLESFLKKNTLSRSGFVLDAAAAFALSCRDANADNCKGSKVDGWLTGA